MKEIRAKNITVLHQENEDWAVLSVPGLEEIYIKKDELLLLSKAVIDEIKPKARTLKA